MEFDILTSAIIYITVFAVSACLAYAGQKKNIKFLQILAMALPILLVGLRLNAGTDTSTYRTFYKQVSNESFPASMSRIQDGTMEPLIIFFARAGAAMHMDASFVFTIFAAITIISLYYATRNLSKEHAWLYYGMILFIVYPEGINIMRQIAAISVQALALSYIIKQRRASAHTSWLLVLLLVIFSIGLHYSSLLLVPVLLVPSLVKHIRGRTLFLIMSIIIAICLFAFPQALRLVGELGILPQKYLDTFLATPGSIINVNFAMAVILCGVFFANYFRRRSQSDKEYGFLMMFGMIYSAIGFYSGYFGRLSNFFWVFIIIAIVNMVNQLFEKERDKMIVNALISIAYFVLYFVVLGLNEIVPYSII